MRIYETERFIIGVLLCLGVLNDDTSIHYYFWAHFRFNFDLKEEAVTEITLMVMINKSLLYSTCAS